MSEMMGHMRGEVGGEDDEDRSQQVIGLVDSVLRRAIDQGASDVYVSPSAVGMAVTFKLGGELVVQPAIESRDVCSVVARLKILGNLDIAERKLPQNGWFDVAQPVPSRVWVSTLPTTLGEDVRLEIARKAEAPRLEQLHVSESVISSLRRVASARRGLFLVVGPSRDVWSALQGIVGTLGSQGRCLAISGSGALAADRWVEVALDPSRGFTMPLALPSAFRQDFGIVLLSELLDFEAANAALRGALDRVLIAGMFGASSDDAVARLLDMGLDPLLIRDGLAGAMSVRSARMLCADCRVAQEPTKEVNEAFRAHALPVPAQIFRSSGCPSCHGLGYRDQVLVSESFLMSPKLRQLLLRRPDGEQIRKATVGGADPLALDGLEKVRRGLVSFEEFIRATALTEAQKTGATAQPNGRHDSLKLLFDYTKFHIGAYLTLTTAYITVATAKIAEGKPLLSPNPEFFWLAVVAFMVAGLAGGVIASSITQTETRSSREFLNEPIGPWDYKAIYFPARIWTYIEHTSFWIGLISAVLSFI